jgi:KDO2-lipid IV(A) lauroyltransferase
MYYFIYGLLYIISLLPFFIVYGISDLAAFILCRLVRYRRDVVLENIAIAFPEKTAAEHIKIVRRFYRNFTDNFLETLKVLSISGAAFDKRMAVDMDACNQLAAEGRNIQFNSGHQMNWEYASLAISKHLRLPWLAVYKRIRSRPIERLFLKIRSKFGADMIALGDYASRMPALMKQQYALGLIADQNPAFPDKSYWLNFFGKPTPFLPGTDKGPRRNKTAVVFVNMIRIKRGYFKLELEIITEDASEFEDGELTRRYRDFLQNCIRNQPANYLWSHRRWKHEYREDYKKKWIDINYPLV